MKISRITLPAVVLAGASSVAFADGIDITEFLTHVDTAERSGAEVCFLAVALAIIVYAWNLLIVGLPSMRIGVVSPKKILVDLISITLLGQVADRLGMIGMVTLAMSTSGHSGVSRADWVLPMLFYSLCSGFAIGLLVWFCVRRRWGGSSRAALAMAVLAAIATNPAVVSTCQWWGLQFL